LVAQSERMEREMGSWAQNNKHSEGDRLLGQTWLARQLIDRRLLIIIIFWPGSCDGKDGIGVAQTDAYTASDRQDPEGTSSARIPDLGNEWVRRIELADGVGGDCLLLAAAATEY
jgi:hypothetical protein